MIVFVFSSGDLNVMLQHIEPNVTTTLEATPQCNLTRPNGLLSGSSFLIPVVVILSCVVGATIFGNLLVIKTVTKRHQYKQKNQSLCHLSGLCRPWSSAVCDEFLYSTPM